MELNQLSDKEQIEIVLLRTKEHGWDIHYGLFKKKQKDRKNFHILTDNGIILQRTEYKNYLGDLIIEWSMVKKDNNERIKGNYEDIISEFVKEYIKTHRVICL